MKISVIITTYNRRQLLERSLASLATQNLPANEFELIVVDDGSADATVDLLRSFSPGCTYRWLKLQNSGQAAAQNRGVQAAQGDFLLFMDDDCICEPDLVAAHLDAHSKSDHLLVRGSTLVHPDSPRGPIYDLKRQSAIDGVEQRLSQGVNRAHMMLGANSSISREAMLDCMFDPTYERIHDVENGVRLWDKGYRPHFAPKAIAHEIYSKSENSLLSDCYNQGKYEFRLTARYPNFKPFAGVAKLSEGSALRCALRNLLAIRRDTFNGLLRGAESLANVLRFLPLCSRLAVRILGARCAVACYQGAAREAGSWQALTECFGKRVPVLMYHYVGSPRPGEYPGLTVTVRDFENHIRYLASHGFKAILPSEWLAWRNEGSALPAKPVMLVFDDACLDLSRVAFPILEQFGFRAACMVATKYIGSTNRWDEEKGRPSFSIMSEMDIREWSKRGIEFGGHTRHHLDLRLISAEEVNNEVEGCKDELAALLGEAPVSFAYPFGGGLAGRLRSGEQAFSNCVHY